MDSRNITGFLEFLRKAENLKNTIRTARTSNGRDESSAEHTWRLCLMLIALEQDLAPLDMTRLLKMAIIHDLAEAECGDIPAVDAGGAGDKSAAERRGIMELTASLSEERRAAILSLWEEYEGAASAEAAFLKGLDKLETILQHNQGENPDGFDYEFNLLYGKRYTEAHPLLSAIRERADQQTRERARAARTRRDDAAT